MAKREDIELAVKLVNLEKVKRQIDDLYKSMNRQSTASVKIAKGLGIATGATLGRAYRSMSNIGTFFARTIKSAIARTMAYSLVNLPRQIIRSVSISLKELGEVDLDVARASAILGVKTGDASKQMQNLYKAMADVTKTGHLSASEFGKVAFSLSLAGLKAGDFTQTLDVINKLSLISGENSKNLSFNFLKLARAFDISGKEFKSLGDALAAGMTTSLSKMSDFLDAAKYLGPMWKQAYGGGIQSAKDFIAVTAALNDQAIRSTTGARGLATGILKLMTPSSKATALLARYNLNLFDSTGKSYKYSAAIRRLQKDLGKLLLKERDLTLERASLIAKGITGDALTKNTEKLTQVQAKEAALTKEINNQYDLFIKVGGKLKRPIDLVREFNNALKKGTMSTTGFAQLLKTSLGIRSSRSLLGLTNGMDILIQKMKEQEEAQKRMDKLYKKIDESFGAILDKWEKSIGKLGKLLDKVFLSPPFQAFYQLFQKYVLNPFNEFLASDKAVKFRENLVSVFTKLFTPTAKSAGKLTKLLLTPEKLGFKYGTKEYQEALKKAFKDVGKNISPIFSFFGKLFANIFYKIGSTAGKAFVNGLLDNIGIVKFARASEARNVVYNIFKRVTGRSIQEVTYAPWIKSAQIALDKYKSVFEASKHLEDIPKKYRQASLQAALTLKNMGYEVDRAFSWTNLAMLSLKRVPQKRSLIPDFTPLIKEITKGVSSKPIEPKGIQYKAIYTSKGNKVIIPIDMSKPKEEAEKITSAFYKEANKTTESIDNLGNTIIETLKKVNNKLDDITNKIRINQRTGGS